MLTSERLPHTMQMSCGLSLTTSHSAHNTAYCSDTAFKGRPAASKLPAFDWFITAPWEEVLHTEHFAGDCQGLRMAHVGHSAFIFQYGNFLSRAAFPNVQAKDNSRSLSFANCDKCPFGDLEASIVIYFDACYGDFATFDQQSTIIVVRSQKPELRITKWLRRVQSAGQRIPIEAECTACADAQFKIKHDKRREWMNIFGGIGMHSPDRDNCTHVLERLFEEHLKLVHPDEYATREHNRPSGQ